MIDYTRVWEFTTWGLTTGFGLAFLFWMLGLWTGLGLRWFEEMIGRS